MSLEIWGAMMRLASCDCCCTSDVFSCFSGFFRSDALIGTVNLKLQPLETHCEIHDSFDVSICDVKLRAVLGVSLNFDSF